MADDTLRSVEIVRTDGRFSMRNIRGGSIPIGTGKDGDFTPVELLLAAIGACTALDVDALTSRRAEPTEFAVTVTGNKVRDEAGANRMVNLSVEFTVSFPDGDAGDAARAMLPDAIRMSHDRLCVVSRTVELGTPVSTTATNHDGPALGEGGS
ncbi:MAG TPA: OsmC family protein [Micromonosporaceae bacterium]|nr:OsmC family protein [Micromonosporaceae bacterium]